MKVTKKRKEINSKVDFNKEYSITEAVAKLKETSKSKFNESIDIAMRLGVDPRQADQLVRGTVALPHGTGKTVRVLVVAKPEKQEEARNAGADHVGFDDYLAKIKEGWADVDVIIAAPDTMSELGKLGKVLGPKGLMPNPKSGTVTNDLAKAVNEVKAGRIEFRVEKAGIVHACVGKASFEPKQLEDNIHTFINQVLKMKPATSKGQYVKSVTLTSTMGPGLAISKNELAHH
ncbi:MAG TPA: 50S ribosomal protein L1 [Ignavibacteria bacterium]|mgnify:FL=1|nr:50S ribosomal protein L1 [Bacteroidota bacterium]HRE10022.1 50S ribosomal protein L1 [Ignavibacteria bacterium]HRF66911.1 50S ribosomal protein L1 [Ignavibacteria bacterium]HRJ04634.1 50S ribosomal protein L1 [Ignavibacteria bacterium]